MLNADLSKKVQEYKISLNATNNELSRTRDELMVEKLKSSELRRALNIMNLQCTDFFNSYMLNLQKCIERTDLEITMPGVGTSSAAANCTSRPNKQLATETNALNLLNTIQEESAFDNQFLDNENIVASTPLITNSPRHPPSPSLLEEEEVAGPSSLVMSPRNLISTPERSSTFSRMSKQRDNDETSSEEEFELSVIDEGMLTSVTKIQKDITRRQSLSVSDESSAEELMNESRETEDVTEKSVANLSLTNFPIRELHINLTKTSVPTTVIKQYKESFIPSQQIADHQDESTETKENIREESVDTTTSTNSSLSMIKGRRKRPALVEIPRRSTGRPKRKARQLVATLAEVPLNRKMRRSK